MSVLYVRQENRIQLTLINLIATGQSNPQCLLGAAADLFNNMGLGPISSTSLRRVFVLKTSYEVRTLKIGFHQTIELCELLIFCRIFKTNI